MGPGAKLPEVAFSRLKGEPSPVISLLHNISFYRVRPLDADTFSLSYGKLKPTKCTLSKMHKMHIGILARMPFWLKSVARR